MTHMMENEEGSGKKEENSRKCNSDPQRLAQFEQGTSVPLTPDCLTYLHPFKRPKTPRQINIFAPSRC